VEAVYIPLPNHLHLPWAIRCIEAGKHVLCEKPLALTADEGDRLVRAAADRPRLKVMEAFMYRHHPQWDMALQRLREGGVGDLRSVQAAFSIHNVNPDDIRNQQATGGGGLLDLGCYCISAARLVWGCEPRRVVAWIEIDPQFRVDRLVSAILEFPDGTATFTVGTQLTPHQRVTILGTQGGLEFDTPFSPPPDQAPRLVHRRQAETTDIPTPAADHFALMCDRFALAALRDEPVAISLADSLANLRVIDAVFRSARPGTWVDI
jgi:predicted dehydrogenase